MSEKRNEEKGFQVKDRRFSTQQETPEKTETGAVDPAAAPAAAAAEEEQAASRTDPEGSPRTGETPLPEITFSTFVLSLNSSVLFHLGFLADPASGQKQKNLPLAKQTIDLLGMLEEKTTGNLSSDEAQMLKNILYDLRISYIRVLG